MKIEEITYAENERILLRFCREEDAAVLKNVFDAPLTEEQTAMMIAHFIDSQKEGKEANLAIVDKERDAVVGILCLYDIRRDNSLAIGYRIVPEERRKHYAADAVRLISPLLIEKYGALCIRGSAHTDNIASINVLDNSGYKLIAQEKSVCMFLYDQSCIRKLS